jgi:serine O-acetyltransferase
MSSSVRFIDCLRPDLLRLSPDPALVSGLRLWIRVLHPRYFPVLLVRLSAMCYRHALSRPLAFLFSAINMVLFGLEVTPRCQIGGGLLLPHTVGTVIGAIEIGGNATIFQGVTLGSKALDFGYDPGKRPILGDNVVIGAGAKVLGGIRIGTGAVVAANSLVLSDVPENARVMGVPAEERRTGA